MPLPPGGLSDIVLRPSLEGCRAALKQPVYIDNKPGAAGNVGAGEAAKLRRWPYLAAGHRHAVDSESHVYPKLSSSPMSWCPSCAPAPSARRWSATRGWVWSVADLVGLARSKPLSYARREGGLARHLSTELFKERRRHPELTHVPYKGPAPAIQGCDGRTGPLRLPRRAHGAPRMSRANKLTALAVSGTTRSPLLPDVPTVSESGYPGFDATFSRFFAPRACRPCRRGDVEGAPGGADASRCGRAPAPERPGGRGVLGGGRRRASRSTRWKTWAPLSDQLGLRPD